MVRKQKRIKSTKFTEDFVVGDFWMSKVGPTKISQIFGNSVNGNFDGLVIEEGKVRIFDLDGVVGPWSKGEYNLIYKITPETNPEYYL